jgi:hypothetical protein
MWIFSLQLDFNLNFEIGKSEIWVENPEANDTW